MSIKTEKFEGNSVLHRHDLSGPELQLDLTSPPYHLEDGQCSKILGWDVLSLNKDRPDRGRRSLGVSLPLEDRPLTWAEEINAEALLIKNRAGVIVHYLAYDGATAALEASNLRASGFGTYAPSTGRLTAASAFAGYTVRDGDRLAMGQAGDESFSLQGVFPISGKVSDSIIITTPGMTLIPASGGVEFMVFQGKGFAPFTPVVMTGLLYLVMSPDEYDANGPWDANSKLLLTCEDGRVAASDRYPVLKVTTFARKNDALSIQPTAAQVGTVGPMRKFTVLSESRHALQGVICGNGRKFWLLNNNTYSLLLDLGEDQYLGSAWRQSRIASNRILLVNEKFPPIVLHLSDRGITLTKLPEVDELFFDANNTLPYGNMVDLDRVLGGMIPPAKPYDIEFNTSQGLHRYPSWLMENGSGGTSTEAGRIKCFVRAVNIYDNLASDFVEVIEANGQNIPTVLATTVSTSKKNLLTLTAGDYATVFAAMKDTDTGFAASLWAPFFHLRATHIEIWRTESIPSPGEGVNYYKEALVLLANLPVNENDSGNGAAYANNYGPVVPLSTDATKRPIQLSNANLVSLPILTNSEFEWGRLPPICRDAVSIGGITLCFGKASQDRVRPTIYIRDYIGRDGSYGPQFSTDGRSYSMASATGWAAGAGWVIGGGGGYAVHVNGSANVLETTTNFLKANTRYRIRFTLNLVSLPGTVRVGLGGGGQQGVDRSVAGTYEEEFLVGGADASLLFTPSSAFAGRIHLLEISAEISDASGGLAEYTWKDGDILEVIDGGISTVSGLNTATVPPGYYRITAKPNATTLSLYPAMPVSLTQGVPLHMHYAILRPFILDWPSISSDEEVWYSRTDRFQPEGFSNRILPLSKNGDLFRRAIAIGNFAVAVMDQGVHILYLSGTAVLKDTIEDVGAGTPWPDSVAVVGNSVVWATPQGAKILKVNADINTEGNRASLSWLTDLRFESWFLEAANNGETIDTGVDRTNQCLRFRRKKSSNVYQVLQYSLRTQRWTLLDDDNGLRYASTRYAEAQPKTLPLLYTVDATGSALEVNLRNRSGYPGSVVQSLTPLEDWEVTTQSIRRKSAVAFSSRMVGDIVRFRFSDPAVTDVVRTILTAGPMKITFDEVPGMSNGGTGPEITFLIGAVRFQRRHAPMTGSRKENVKTLHEGFLRMRKGESGGGNLTVRLFEELAEESTIEETLEIASVQSPQNFVLSKTAQGSAIELELESFDVESDFELETVEATLREEEDSVIRDS